VLSRYGWNIPGIRRAVEERWIGDILIQGVASIWVRSSSGLYRTVN